jgi:hypothetical protein
MSVRGDYGCHYRPGGFFAAVSITVSASVSAAVSTTTVSTTAAPAGRKRHRSGLRYWRCRNQG